MDEFVHSPYIALFLIIGTGFLLGKLKIRGFSLDVSAVLFVALLFGHFGVVIPRDFEYVGLLLFIFTIGIQAGPGFFRSFAFQGTKLAVIALILTVSGFLISLAASTLFHIDPVMAIGLFTGAFTSTPGLAAAMDTTQSSAVSIGYGIAYPIGVTGVILFIRLLPKILSVKPRDAEEAINEESREEYPHILSRHFRVENENIFGKTLSSLNIREMTGASISRVLKKETAMTPEPATILEKGDLVRAVGTENALRRAEVLIGSPTNREIPLGKEYEVQSLLVTNKKLVNKTLGQLNLFRTYGATVTRVRRSGIDIAPANNIAIRLGDKLMIACSRDNMRVLAEMLGNDNKILSHTNFFPIALGIVLGVLLGKVKVVFSEDFSFSLGLTGGVLAVALVVGHLGKTGPIVWTMSGNANQLIRQLGLLFFLSSVGTHAGTELVEVVSDQGLNFLLAGALITIVPLVLSSLAGHYILHINMLRLLGGLTGGMTSTPGLVAAESLSSHSATQEAYAAVYPIAMVLMILFVQLLGLIIIP